MRALNRILIVVLVACPVLAGGAAAGTDIRDSLNPQDIGRVRINLNPGGAQLGFEAEFARSVFGWRTGAWSASDCFPVIPPESTT